MNKVMSISTLIAGACLLVAGCGAPDGENPFEEDDFTIPFDTSDGPRGGDNGDDPKCFWSDATQYHLRKLGAAKLDLGDGFMLDTSGLTDCERKIVGSAIMCALNDKQTVVDPGTGAIYTGWYALDEDWLTKPLSTDGRRWVTACMLQKLNAYSVTVPILLEGDHTSIKQNATWDPVYSYEEATIFGDLFSSTQTLGIGAPAFRAHVCAEDDMVQQCQPGGAWIGLWTRICDTSPLCGLNNLGPCSTAGTPNGYYWTFPNQGYTQAVRVQLKPPNATCYKP
jgi:hypothetical protein